MRKGDDLTTFTVPEALTFRILKGLFRPAAGKLYLYLYEGGRKYWHVNIVKLKSLETSGRKHFMHIMKP